MPHLQKALAVVALIPRQIKKDWAQRVTAKTKPAKAKIADRLIGGVDRHFDVGNPGLFSGPPTGSREVNSEQ
jgi:hypothetical protein